MDALSGGEVNAPCDRVRCKQSVAGNRGAVATGTDSGSINVVIKSPLLCQLS